jgi:hypothetical protein
MVTRLRLELEGEARTVISPSGTLNGDKIKAGIITSKTHGTRKREKIT